MQRMRKFSELRISLMYVFFGGLWILFSDRALNWLVSDPVLNLQLQTYKGWVYVLVTGAMLFIILRIENQARQDIEEEYYQLFHASPDSLFLIQPDGKILEANLTAVSTFGYAKADLEQMSIVDLIPAGEQEQAMSQITNGIEQGTGQFTWQYHRKDGTELPVEIMARSIRLKKQVVLLASVRDIRPQVQIRTQLMESEARFRQLVENAGDGFFLIDENLKILEVNEAACRSLGYTREELTQKSLDKIDTLTNSSWSDWLMAVPLEESITGEGTFLRKDGTSFPVEIHLSMVVINGKKLGLGLARDITDRKKAEDALQESAAHYQSLFRDSPTPLWDEDFSAVKTAIDSLKSQGVQDFEIYLQDHPEMVREWVEKIKVIDVNEAGARLFEVEDKNQVKENILAFSNDPSLKGFREEFIHIAKGDRHFTHETTARTLFDNDLNIEVFWSAAPGYEETLSRVFVAAVDVTGRRLAEEALRETSERFQTLIQASPIAILMLDPEGNVHLWNKAAERIFGWKSEEVLGTHLPYVHPEAMLEHRQLLERTFAGESIVGWETQRMRRDGQLVDVSINTAPMRRPDGKIDRIVDVVADITDRKKVENSRKALLDQINLILERMPVGCVIYDPDFRVTYWNPEAELIFGYQQAEILGRTTTETITPPSARGYVEEIKKRLMHGEREAHSVNENVTRDGRRIYCEWRNTPLKGEEGVLIGYLSMVQDVTSRVSSEMEIHKLNQELEQRVSERTVQLREMVKELETFTYSVSHDLKAPLRAIDGYSRLLSEDYANKLDAEGQDFLTKIRKSTAHMARLIDDLLVYSRLERRQVAISNVNPREMVENILSDRANEIEQRGIRVSVDIPFEEIQTDEQSLLQALRNLIDNAFKYTRLTREPHIIVSGHETAHGWKLSVQDNGIGFDMQYHDQIFKIFHRLHLAEDFEGTGIGLALVRKAMDRTGGKVWAESRPGDGSTFTLEIRKPAD